MLGARDCRLFEQRLTAVDLVDLHLSLEISVGVPQLCFQSHTCRAESVKYLAQQHDGPSIRSIAKSKVHVVQRTMLNHPIMEGSQVK